MEKIFFLLSISVLLASFSVLAAEDIAEESQSAQETEETSISKNLKSITLEPITVMGQALDSYSDSESYADPVA